MSILALERRPRHELSISPENRQRLERLAGQFQSQPNLAKFLRLKVNFKRGKTNYLPAADLVWHRWVGSIGKSLALTNFSQWRSIGNLLNFTSAAVRVSAWTATGD